MPACFIRLSSTGFNPTEPPREEPQRLPACAALLTSPPPHLTRCRASPPASAEPWFERSVATRASSERGDGRLQGFAPLGDPDLRRGGLDHGATGGSLGFPPSQGPDQSRRAQRFTPSSSPGVRIAAFQTEVRLARAVPLRSIQPSWWARSLSRPAVPPGFPPCHVTWQRESEPDPGSSFHRGSRAASPRSVGSSKGRGAAPANRRSEELSRAGKPPRNR